MVCDRSWEKSEHTVLRRTRKYIMNFKCKFMIQFVINVLSVDLNKLYYVLIPLCRFDLFFRWNMMDPGCLPQMQRLGEWVPVRRDQKSLLVHAVCGWQSSTVQSCVCVSNEKKYRCWHTVEPIAPSIDRLRVRAHEWQGTKNGRRFENIYLNRCDECRENYHH